MTRSWKLFLLLPHLLRAREPGTVGREAVLQHSRAAQAAAVALACRSTHVAHMDTDAMLMVDPGTRKL